MRALVRVGLDAAGEASHVGASGGHITLNFWRLPSRVDLDYVVEASGDLGAGPWTEIARSSAGNATIAAPGQSQLAERDACRRRGERERGRRHTRRPGRAAALSAPARGPSVERGPVLRLVRPNVKSACSLAAPYGAGQSRCRRGQRAVRLDLSSVNGSYATLGHVNAWLRSVAPVTSTLGREAGAGDATPVGMLRVPQAIFYACRSARRTCLR